MDVLWAKVTSKLMEFQNRELDWRNLDKLWLYWLLSSELPGIPQYSPQDQENAEMGLWEASTGWCKKEDEVLIPETQQWPLTKSLPEATHYGRGALWDLMQKGFYREGV